jgi:heterodisulfide reductase subunit A-like polyferredoxin
MSTQIPGVFAGADVTTGPKTVIECIEAGQKAAASIVKYLQKMDKSSKYTRNECDKVSYPMDLPPEEFLNYKKRIPVNKIPAGVRNRTFVEVAMTMNPEEAIAEASRCLRCDIEG